jgi:hypothetical protein
MSTLKTVMLQVLITAAGLTLLSTEVTAWPFKQDHGRATCVAVDRDGDVIAGGSFSGVGPTFDVFKLSGRDGSVIWHYHQDSGSPVRIAVDPNGDVIVGGNIGITKLSGATGAELWIKNVVRTTDLKVDQGGNIIATGMGLFQVVKLDTDGHLTWNYLAPQGRMDGQPVPSDDYAAALAIDQAGDVFAVGQVGWGFAVRKISGQTGMQLGARDFDDDSLGSNSDVAKAVAVDAAGDAVVAGDTVNADRGSDFTLMKFHGDSLALSWEQRIDGKVFGIEVHQEHFSHPDHANALALDSVGDVVVAGSLFNSYYDSLGHLSHQGEQFTLMKFAGGSGDVLWTEGADYDQESPTIVGAAYSVVVNLSGNVIATGNYDGSFTVLKKHGTSGKNWWRYSDPSRPTAVSDPSIRGYEVVLDARNDVLAAGVTQVSDQTPQRFTVVKLDRLSGATSDGPTNTITALAPLVYLHSSEDFFPDNPMRFIHSSSLRWSEIFISDSLNISQLVAPRNFVSPNRLGSVTPKIPRYVHTPLPMAAACIPKQNKSKVRFYSTNYTRPYDSEKRAEDKETPYSDTWLNNCYKTAGFYLDLDNTDEAREGMTNTSDNPHVYSGAPVFYEYQPHSYITYWFFYAYDEFRTDGLVFQSHEGDWERVSILLDFDEEPQMIRYYYHSHHSDKLWKDIILDEGHPVVYSALGTHASYDTADSHPIEEIPVVGGVLGVSDHTDAGYKWSTWNNLLRVEIQPWYGYGGAWGAVRGGGTTVSGEMNTGPLGPSRHKNTSREWTDGDDDNAPPPSIKEYGKGHISSSGCIHFRLRCEPFAKMA